VQRRDLSQPGEIEAAVRGIGSIVHAAALVNDWGRLEDFQAINVDLTARLSESARKEGCRVFVYISSVAVHGFGPHVYSCEEGPYYPLFNPYQLTKKMAEELVLSQSDEGFRTCSIRPGNVCGPGDTTTFYPIFSALEKGVMGYLGGGHTLTCPVYIDDLVKAIVLALEKEQSNAEAFNITGGEEVTWHQLLTHVASLLGVRAPRISLPARLAYSVAGLLSTGYRLLGIRSSPPITRYRVAQLINDYHFSIDKARSLLGYVPRVGWQDGMRRTVAAYQEDASKIDR
jgi:nucleoside-diphosphate-sugar epimerase